MAERTRIINRLHWHLHELDPSWQPRRRACGGLNLAATTARLRGVQGIVARLARALLQRCRMLIEEIAELDQELEPWSPVSLQTLIELCGCATLTAAKILGETADVERFHSRHAYARHNGTAPVPVWSGNRKRHRLSRIGNRQLNAALHRITITQARYHPPAREFLQRRRAGGDTKTESIRALKRRLSDVVYRALLADASSTAPPPAITAAA